MMVSYERRELQLGGTRNRAEYTMVARTKERRTVFRRAERLRLQFEAMRFRMRHYPSRSEVIDGHRGTVWRLFHLRDSLHGTANCKIWRGVSYGDCGVRAEDVFKAYVAELRECASPKH